MISAIMLQVLKISLFTSLLIGLLLLLVPLLQKRYRAKWRYIAWLVIAVRLLIPIHFSLPQAPINIELPEQKTIATVTAPSHERPYLQMDIPPLVDADISQNFEEVSGMTDETTNPMVAVTPLGIAGVIWFAGVLIFLFFQVCSYQLFLRKLKRSQTEKVSTSIQEIVWKIGVDMGVCKLPEPIITNATDAPVLIGVIHPRILLPHMKYEAEKLAFILRHELVHYRRSDMWYKLILLLANALHWFNPLVYLMTVQAAKDIELACDDDVIRELDHDARARYGDTILSALPRKRRLEPVFSTHFGSSKKNIKSRLRNLFDMTMKRRGIAALCAVTACALMITSFVTIGYAAKPNTITEPEQSAQLPKISKPATSISENFAVQRLGKHTIQDVDALKINLKWNGKGNVMLLYTDQDYTDDEILVPLQGIPGLPKPNYDNVDKKKVQGVFNFSSSPTSPLIRQNRVARSGTYYFYMVQYGFDTFNRISGEVSRINAEGDIYGIWGAQSEAVNENAPDSINIKSIEAGAVTCIGKIKLGPDIAYTAAVSVESGSGAMIALHDTPNITRHAGTAWNLHYGTFIGSSNVHFSSEQPKTAYVYVGSQAINGTKLTNVTVNLVQTKPPALPNGNPYFTINSNGEKNAIRSGYFGVKNGQKLKIAYDCDIKGGMVDLFLFSPSGNEQRFTFGGTSSLSGTGAITIPVSAGTWAYNCTGFFESGNIEINGTLSDTAPVGMQINQPDSSDKGKSTAVDKAAYEVMQYSRSWEMVEYMLPYMTKEGIDAVVKLNNELNPSDKKTASNYYNLATPSKTESDQRSYTLMEKSGNWKYSSPLFPYMTNDGIDKVVALYNQKTGKKVKAVDYHN